MIEQSRRKVHEEHEHSENIQILDHALVRMPFQHRLSNLKIT